MKRYIFLIALAAMAFPGQELYGKSDKDRETEYLSSVRLEAPSLVKDGKTMLLSMDIVLDSTRIKTQHTVTLTPVYISHDGSREQEFKSLIIDGRTRNKVFMRTETLEKQTPEERQDAIGIITRKNRSAQSYSYLASIPYERWMLDGSVSLREEIHGCADCEQGRSSAPLLEGIRTFTPSYELDTIVPAPEPVKIRNESRSARLEFKTSKYDILPDWRNNRTELDSVRRSIELIKDRNYVTIIGISVTGYASPEGTYESNMTLSHNRAASFASYISRTEGIDKSLLHVEWGGEDWEGFKTLLRSSSTPSKDRIIEIIDTWTEDRNVCETRMRAILSAEEYKWILDNIYPFLRQCLYKIEYKVENFNLEEARRIIYTRPQDLSLSEMYQVAGSYEKGSRQYDDAMRTASACYPDAPAVLNDRAIRAISEGDAASAAEFLRLKIPEGDAIMLNTYGVACALSGEYDAALKALTEAASVGNEKAIRNLAQLEAVIDQL